MRKLLKTCIPQKGYKTFTIKRTEAESTPAQMFLGYFDDAAGMTQGSSDFDTFFAYRPVLLNTQGQVTAELNPNNYAEDINGNPVDITGGDNVMVEFPRRGIKMSKDGDVVTLSITDRPDAEADGFQYFAHSRGTFENPIKKDKFYLGAYKGFISVSNQRLQSWSNRMPTGHTKFDDFLLAARRNDNNTGDNGYELQGYYQRMYIIALYFMKYGNPNSQSVIGLGFTGGFGVPQTGATNTIGMTGVTDSSSTGRVKLFGIEDVRGAAHEFVAGVKTGLEADEFPLYTALSNFNSTMGGDYGGYTNQGPGVVLGRQNRNVTKIVGDNYKMFAVAANAPSSTYDAYYCNNAQVLANRICIIGHSYNGGKAAGITRVYLGAEISSMSNANVSRLMYL